MSSIEKKKIALYLKIGIIGALVILAGDMIMGWGIKDTSIGGIVGFLAFGGGGVHVSSVETAFILAGAGSFLCSLAPYFLALSDLGEIKKS